MKPSILPKITKSITLTPDEATALVLALHWARFLADSLAYLRGNTEAVKVSKLCSEMQRLIASKAGDDADAAVRSSAE